MNLLPWALAYAAVCYGAVAAIATLRLVIGPRAQDRVLALDTLYANALLLLILLSLRSGEAAYLDVALLISLTGMVGSVALGRFLLRGEVIEP